MTVPESHPRVLRGVFMIYFSVRKSAISLDAALDDIAAPEKAAFIRLSNGKGGQ